MFYHGGSTAAVVSAQCKLTLTNSPPEQPLAAFLTPLTPPPPPCSSSGPLSIVSIQLSLFTSMPHQDIYISQYLPPPRRSAGSSQLRRKEVSECCANWSQCWKPPETTACEKSLTDEWWKLHVAQSKWEPETFSTDIYFMVIQPIMSRGNTSPQNNFYIFTIYHHQNYSFNHVETKEVRSNPPMLLQSNLLYVTSKGDDLQDIVWIGPIS